MNWFRRIVRDCGFIVFKSLFPMHHKKRGSDYVAFTYARVQTDTPLNDMERVIVYIGEDGDCWIRSPSELPGRFDLPTRM